MPPKHNQTKLDVFFNRPGKKRRLDDDNDDDEPQPQPTTSTSSSAVEDSDDAKKTSKGMCIKLDMFITEVCM